MWDLFDDDDSQEGVLGGKSRKNGPLAPIEDNGLVENGSFADDDVIKGRDGNIVNINSLLKKVSFIDDNKDLAWQLDALCAQTDPEAFFPEKGGSTKDAKRVCDLCDVKVECLSHAIEHDERFGIWGGTSERERRMLKRDSSHPMKKMPMKKMPMKKMKVWVK